MRASNAELQIARLVADYPVAAFGSTEQPVGDDATRRLMSAIMLFRIPENQWLEYRHGPVGLGDSELVQRNLHRIAGKRSVSLERVVTVRPVI